jgi:uncharacterized protein (DUF1330 family)
LKRFAGEAPKRAVIAKFDSLEQAQTFRDSAECNALIPLRDQASKYRAYIIEGVPDRARAPRHGCTSASPGPC